MMKNTHTIKTREDQVTIHHRAPSGYGLTWTIDIENFCLTVNGIWTNADGTEAEDKVSIGLIDGNTVAVFI